MMKLGQILVQKQLISVSQLKEAIEIQSIGRQKLGEILVRQGAIPAEVLQTTLLEQIEQEWGLIPPIKLLKWSVKDNCYQAIYTDELGVFVFIITPEIHSGCEKKIWYEVRSQYQLSDGTIAGEVYGLRETLQAAQQLAEEQFKQLL